MNGVNSGDTVFVRCGVSVCLCAAALNANSTKSIKPTDFKFELHVPMDSPDMTHYKFFEKGPWPGSRE